MLTLTNSGAKSTMLVQRPSQKSFFNFLPFSGFTPPKKIFQKIFLFLFAPLQNQGPRKIFSSSIFFWGGGGDRPYTPSCS
jgi:hypothetical protein